MPETINIDALKADETSLRARYQKFKNMGLRLDMTRGKPAPEQLDLANDMINILSAKDYKDINGVDCRNYGGLDGLAEAKKLFADFLEVNTDEIIIGGNASLNIMHDIIVRAITHGTCDSDTPWGKLNKIKFLCPAPGYDRHFAICEHFGIEMITIGLEDNGDPKMDEVQKLVANDDSIKGMWFVPKYGNPTGLSVSDATVDKLASMPTAAKDFRIMWDNAYTVHHLNDNHDKIKNLLEACKANGNDNRAFIIGSTSKVSFAGAGVSMVGCSQANIAWLKSHLSIQTIGPDKLNQLRHIKFFKNMDGIKAHMQKHAAIIKPKFEKVLEILENELGKKNIAKWSNPNGGYFINFDVPNNCAKKVVAMASEAGVKLTGAGATFPYKKDPNDCNIRIAPTLPSITEIAQAMEIVAICVQIAAIENL